MNVVQWPFLPEIRRTPDQNAAWWEQCYQPGPIEIVLQNSVGWSVVINRGGDGASTILKSFERILQSDAQAVYIDYHPHTWQTTGSEGGGHIASLLQLASLALRNRLKNEPERLGGISVSQEEFLRWLIERFNDLRAYPRWLDSLPEETAARLRNVNYIPEFYPSHIEMEGARGPIEELGNLILRLGFGQLIFLLDAPYFMPAAMQEKIYQLFSWLTLMEHPAVRVVAALPEPFVDRFELILQTRDRVNYLNIPSEPACGQQILQRYLACATLGQITQLEQAIPAQLWPRLEKRLAVEFAGSGFLGWVGLAQAICNQLKNLSGPLTESNLKAVWSTWYASCLPLRIDPAKPVVWRGYRPIQLDDAPFDFLQNIWRARGKPLDQFGAGISSQNKHTLARRVRAAIEPGTGQPIYLHNARGQGYWLENTIFD